MLLHLSVSVYPFICSQSTGFEFLLNSWICLRTVSPPPGQRQQTCGKHGAKESWPSRPRNRHALRSFGMNPGSQARVPQRGHSSYWSFSWKWSHSARWHHQLRPSESLANPSFHYDSHTLAFLPGAVSWDYQGVPPPFPAFLCPGG